MSLSAHALHGRRRTDSRPHCNPLRRQLWLDVQIRIDAESPGVADGSAKGVVVQTASTSPFSVSQRSAGRRTVLSAHKARVEVLLREAAALHLDFGRIDKIRATHGGSVPAIVVPGVPSSLAGAGSGSRLTNLLANEESLAKRPEEEVTTAGLLLGREGETCGDDDADDLRVVEELLSLEQEDVGEITEGEGWDDESSLEGSEVGDGQEEEGAE